MESKIKIRKKRFLALMLVFVFVISQSLPVDVMAATYTLDDSSSLNTGTVQPGDVINYDTSKYSVSTVEIAYLDYDGTVLDSSTTTIENTETIVETMTVKEYTDFAGGKLSTDQFKEWSITEIDGSGSYLSTLTLQAVQYTESTITYVLDGGTNDALNPDTYYEGKENITLNPATKEYYDFEGWYTESTFVNKVESITTNMTGNITLYAKFSLAKYNIIYHNVDGATNPNPSTYTYSVGITSFDAATKTGHTFGGWYSDAGFTTEITGISTTQSGAVDVYAKFTPDTYTINYVLNGGDNAATNPTEYTYGVGVASFADATKTGYTFAGWYSDEAFTNRVAEITTTDIGDITLYAKFSVNSYTISYELDGGENAATNPTGYTYGVGVDSFADATKTGHTFDGWYSDETFTDKVTKITATKSGDVTLYAKYTANTYNINYELDGGENAATNPTEYTYGVGVASFADATKTGYTFDGWYSDETFTTQVTEITATDIEDITLYAKYTAKTYRISYELNGGENAATNPTEYTYGVGIDSFADATKTNYTFAGWYSDEAFTTQVTKITDTYIGDITLYAKYTADNFAINYVLDGGENAATNPTEYTYGIGVASFADATKTGYTFAGWYSDAAFANEVTKISETQSGDVALYAKYTPNTYTINYELDGGENAATNPTEYTYGVGVASFADATKTNYTFAGWYSDAAFTNEITEITATDIGDITLYAKYTPENFAINYVLNGGTNGVGNPAYYVYGEGVASFADATKTGHTFAGWYSDEAFANEVTKITATKSGDVTLYAKYTPNTYTINYELDGGENAATNPTEYTYGVGVASFADATKTGYTFDGWYSDETFTTQVTEITATDIGDITLYAKYTAKTYRISYELNGGENAATNPTQYTYGVGVASFADATKTGHTFAGWYSDAAFTNKVTRITATKSGDVTLYAKYTPNTYTINYELDGGENAATNPTEYTYGVGVASFADATKTGYTFAGWYSDETFTNEVTEITATQTEDITLYARFTVNTYAINYELNGGENAATNPTEYTYGVGVDSFADATKTGHTFAGWYSDEAFTNEVTKITATKTGDVTLYAKFTANTYAINYELDGGENAATNPAEYTYGVGVASFADATKTGHTFIGWYIDEGDALTKVTEITATDIGDKTLYAMYTPATYTINYVLNGGENGEDNPDSYIYGEGVGSFEDATKTGHTFAGWYSDAAFTNKVTEITATDFGDITLYAKFTANKYKINYVLDGGKNAATNPAQYTYGVGVASFADATKTGHTFAGWYSDAEFKTKVTKITATQMDDVTLYAKFTVATYTISYELNGGENAATNPTEYTYGVGVDSFADATKTGHTFAGWYSDAAFTNKVSKITTTQAGNITLYAKFTAKTYAIDYVLDGGENAATNPTEYTYGVGVASFAPATKTGYRFVGWYSDAEFKSEVTRITATKMGNVTLYAKFTNEKTEGTGSISVADVIYGMLPSPVIVSDTNGTDNAVVEYKKKASADAEYSTTKPAAVGAYVARVTFPETDYYYEVIATCEFTISYLETPEVPYRIVGRTGEENYYVSDVAIVPAEGYLISNTLDGTYSEKLNIESSTDGFTVYLMNASTGGKTTGIKVSQIKIDKFAPIIENVTTDSVVYGDSIEVTIRDINLKNVSVNGETVEIDNGKAILNLSSNNGEETYEIICTDIAGNKSEANIIVSADWMKDRIIPANETVKLVTKYSYSLGGGKWKLAGDNTTYSGGITFNVRSDGNYTFTSE